MHLKHYLSVCLSFLFVALCSFSQAAETMLNGIAIHSELGKEQFIGALYSNPVSDNVETLTSTAQSLRMKLKIVSPEGMTTRRYSRMWIEGMAINNPPTLLTEQAENMVKFDGLIKGRLVQNDTIEFSYEQNRGVNVLVNDVLLGNIPGDKFFAMLLKTWVGKIPLSTDYKAGILKVGKVDAALKERFDKIKASKERSTEVAAWSKMKTAVELAEEKAKEAGKSSASQSSSVETAKQLASAKTEAAKEAARIEAAKLAAQKLADDEEKPALTAQTLLARQFYVSDLLRKIRSNTHYPKRSLERNQAGSLRIAVIINRQGNVVSTSLDEASQHELLNKAAQDAVAESAPFPPMPDSITGSTFEFTAPITFVLPK